LIDIAHFRKHAAGFNIIDCSVADRSLMHLLLRRDYTQDAGWNDMTDPPAEGRLQKRVLALRPDSTDPARWGVIRLDGLDRCELGMAFEPERKLVVVDIDSKAWSNNPPHDGFEPPMKSLFEGGLLRGGLRRIRSFGGPLMACTGGRGVFTRTAAGVWEPLGTPPPYVFDSATLGDFGFEDFDRFSATDWYAGGGLSDLWHFDGERWRQCAFPSNQGIFALCCGGDGEVYISAGGGSIWRGRRDRWTCVHDGSETIPIEDLVWHEGRLWASSDYGLWALGDGGLLPAEVPPAVKLCAGNLAARDGVLLVAGYGGAAYQRDGQWQVVFHDHELRQPRP
jgi:hypothetical protein